jgi:hypothetical protein
MVRSRPPVSWTWEQFVALPTETLTVDIHCVTKWSKLDTSWRGVPVRALLDQVTTSADYLTAWSDGGYTTNLAVEDVADGEDQPGFWEGWVPQSRGPVAGTAVSGRLSWQPATVRELINETPRARSIVLDLPDWPGHLADDRSAIHQRSVDLLLAGGSLKKAEEVMDARGL